MGDTLQTILNAIETSGKEQTEIISKVNEFYNSAWEKLVLIGTVSFGIVGIIIPMAIQWYQRRSLKLSEDILKKEMALELENSKKEILEQIQISLKESLDNYERKIEKLNSSMEASTFHLQANSQIEKGLVLDAFADYITAASGYLHCENYINLQIVLRTISNSCLPKLSIEEINDLKIKNEVDFDILLANISDNDEMNTFTEILREIKFKYSKLPKTITERNTPAVP